MSAPDDVARLAAAMEGVGRGHAGEGERFSVYAVLGVPFASGHVLAMRRVPVSPFGHAYTSVWLRDPDGRWTIVSERPPDEACPRYFGKALAAAHVAPIGLRWTGPRRMELSVPTLGLEWALELEATWATRALGAMAARLPAWLVQRAGFLRLMGVLAGWMLGTGRLGLAGRVPNGQRFLAIPERVWMVRRSAARLAGRDLGPMRPLPAQTRLEDFWIPQRGLFAMGEAAFRTDVVDPGVSWVPGGERP